MYVSTLALSIRKWDRPPPLQKIWSLDDSEISKIGEATLSAFAKDSLGAAIAWQGLAILEFAEIQDQTFPKAGPYFNINYFYFEACSVLREALVTGINGSIHASLAVLRPAFEMFVLHRHWKQRRQDAETYDEFYGWFNGSAKAPGFGKLLTESYQPGFPGSVTSDDARKLYAKLCSYVHKPNWAESITTIRRGNVPGVPPDLLAHWTQTLHELQRHIVDLLVRASPASLFPVDITRKFGFNPPVGVLFDHESYRILEKALGRDQAVTVRGAYNSQGVPPEIEWARARPDLTDAKILKSWHDNDTPRLEGKTKADRIRMGRLMLKAKMRVINQSMAYMKDAPSMPDVREFLANLSKEAQELTTDDK